MKMVAWDVKKLSILKQLYFKWLKIKSLTCKKDCFFYGLLKRYHHAF